MEVVEKNSEKTAEETKMPVEEHVDGNNTSGDKNATDNKDEEKKAEEIKSVDASPELLEKIKNQIEFYFGDVNLQRDKFLIEQIKLDEGWIPMTIMLQFKLLAAMSNDVETILKAVEQSDLMEISDNRKKIRRRVDKPLPLYNEEYRRSQTARTVYLKSFPQEVKLDELKEFFKDFGVVENIVMRKYKDENQKLQFKGSIFVQFKNLDDAKALVAKESLKYKDTELIKMMSEDYSLMKTKERQERKGKKNEAEEDEDDESEKTDLPKGAVLHFTVEKPEGVVWEAIKQSFLEQEAKISFVDYKNGQKTGWIRFQGANSAIPLLEKMTDKKIKISDSEITFQLLEGEEEEEYLKKVRKELFIKAKPFNKSKKNRNNKKGFRKSKKRGGSPVQDEVASKKQAK
ncbi:Similar to La protein homolog (Aedes albopictus) [Cotesia congregata]|uniref:Similar to La protein homolog (Aedes albopictus) n=1 Tax=Cotesia congregata TaxID=51543 RepID=A0A8J2MTQ2_COTCN|nr:Similar to La protein homolog (Aedes albopictus) [Cotesia congregata]